MISIENQFSKTKLEAGHEVFEYIEVLRPYLHI